MRDTARFLHLHRGILGRVSIDHGGGHGAFLSGRLGHEVGAKDSMTERSKLLLRDLERLGLHGRDGLRLRGRDRLRDGALTGPGRPEPVP